MSVFGWSLKDWLHTGFLCSPLTIGNIGTEKVRFYSTLQISEQIVIIILCLHLLQRSKFFFRNTCPVSMHFRFIIKNA